jgi:thiopurine S-methyltransferase
MQSSFWLDKWNANQIGFHLSVVHPLLMKFKQQVFGSCERAFVPLAGKSVDLRYLHSQGYDVIANELSELAVEAFFAEQFPHRAIEQTGSYQVSQTCDYESAIRCYSIPQLEILIGDFFQLQPEHITADTIDGLQTQPVGIYDRAALIALPENMRSAYVIQLKRLIPNASMLLVTLDYDQGSMSGPPFSVVPSEIEHLFSFAQVTSLYRKNIIEKEPRFKQKGLEVFYESVYHIRW